MKKHIILVAFIPMAMMTTMAKANTTSLIDNYKSKSSLILVDPMNATGAPKKGNNAKELVIRQSDKNESDLWWNADGAEKEADILKGKPECKRVEMALGACVDLLGGLVHIGIRDPVTDECIW